jgi:aspartyl-tRNA(Asn)/glutamyl-tRNA(Gln) amidotransferase subunit B
MRCDANVSIRPVGRTTLGTRAEVKNMNSMRSVRDAITHEVARQIALVESGGRVVQETRLWSQDLGTHPVHAFQRRGPRLPLFPRPGFGSPGAVGRLLWNFAENALPELPEARRVRYEAELGLSAYDASGCLTAEKTLADFFETALARFDAAERPTPPSP